MARDPCWRTRPPDQPVVARTQPLGELARARPGRPGPSSTTSVNGPSVADRGDERSPAGAALRREVGADQHDVGDRVLLPSRAVEQIAAASARPSAFQSVSVRLQTRAGRSVNAPEQVEQRAADRRRHAPTKLTSTPAIFGPGLDLGEPGQLEHLARPAPWPPRPSATARRLEVLAVRTGSDGQPAARRASRHVHARWDRPAPVRASCDPLGGRSHVVGVGVVPDEVATGPHRGDAGGARAHERVEDQVAGVGVEVDQPLRQRHRERRGVPDPAWPTPAGSPTGRAWRP